MIDCPARVDNTVFIHACFNTHPRSRLHYIVRDIKGVISNYLKITQLEFIQTCLTKKISKLEILELLKRRVDLYVPFEDYRETNKAIFNLQVRSNQTNYQKHLFECFYVAERNKKFCFNHFVNKLDLSNLKNVNYIPTSEYLNNSKIVIYIDNLYKQIFFSYKNNVLFFSILEISSEIFLTFNHVEKDLLNSLNYNEIGLALFEKMVSENSSSCINSKSLLELGLL